MVVSTAVAQHLAKGEPTADMIMSVVVVVVLPLLASHRLLSSSFLGLPFWILNMNHKKELLRSLWVERNRSKHKFTVFASSKHKRPQHHVVLHHVCNPCGGFRK